MKQKAFVLQNKGMNRDLSASKTGESSAYENHNIRILARDHDTLLSVTNERGNKIAVIHGLDGSDLRVTEDEEIRITEDELYRVVDGTSPSDDIDIHGILIGWNVLNNNVVLFTNEGVTDRIYHIWYENDEFYGRLLFQGFLNFCINHPIESVVYHETDEIQKIYWVDGRNVLRFMNFVAQPDETTGLLPWQISEDEYDNTYFDSNRKAEFGVDVSISKDNSGNTRANGVVQYLLTYYNKHGQETGYVWISDLIYLSPVASGGAADGTNNNSVTLTINDLDTRFDHFRVYSVFRSALNGTTIGYIIFDGETEGGSATVVDNNAHLTAIDSSQLLYLGSHGLIAGTLAHKDQTLFLGDLSSVDRNYDSVEKLLRSEMIMYGWESKFVEFYPSADIPHEVGDGNYTYSSQLVKSSSEITSFKGGEKYRFAIVFHKKDGSMTDAFWIGDKVNKLYPIIGDDSIQRIIARCTLPESIVWMMRDNGFVTAQLMIAEATYADRSVKAQGIVCPTMFNVWDRYMNRVYSASSWLMRPRNSEYAWKHFEPVHNSISSTGEIDCNYWETENAPTPYYVLKNYTTTKDYVDEFDGQNDYDYAILIYRATYTWTWYNNYSAGAMVILIKDLTGSFSPSSYLFSGNALYTINSLSTSNDDRTYTYTTGGLEIRITNFGLRHIDWVADSDKSKEGALTEINKAIREKYSFFGSNELADFTTFKSWCQNIPSAGDNIYFNYELAGESYSTIQDAVNDVSGNHGYGRWCLTREAGPSGSTEDYLPSYYKKHLAFVDENVVTLNSPEIDYEAVSFDKIDGHLFRIVGIAKIDGNYSDYTVDASPSRLSGESVVKENLSKTLIAWPLWKESSITERTVVENGDASKESDKYTPEEDVHDRDSYDYVWGGGTVRYWLRLWNHIGKISGFTDYNEDDYSELHRKVFANARFSNKTVYVSEGETPWFCAPDSIRIYNYTSSQYVMINIADSVRNYDGIINSSFSLPGSHKYPIVYSVGAPSPSDVLEKTDEPYLYQSDPVPVTYASSAHAVISLPTNPNKSESGKKIYEQTILPRIASEPSIYFDRESGTNTGALLPWINNGSDTSYPYKDYSVKQDILGIGFSPSAEDKYVYIGEIYSNLDDGDDIRYGGTSDAAIQNNRFVVAGPQVLLSDMNGDGSDVLVANQGDTYIQRWDCLKTKPYSTSAMNNVIDITSVMLETHINIDGRTDLQRGTSYIASIDTEKWGSLNHVYSQKNNFIARRDLDKDFNLDAYRSSITWTLEKHDSDDVDEWTHITLASTLKLDGDKGICRALRRLQNSIIAFQDRGISEILFNSRTQLTTTDGVPVEIANSGKVDGKRYITNKYGCTNKWSIVEGKAALYFVDNINKAFCAFNGQAIDNLSTKLGFGVWFRDVNSLEAWKPSDFNNIVSYYDKTHSDIYLVRNSNDEMPCLVYNENLAMFTSFFDYRAVLMMTNVEDRFLSFKNHRVWLQNEGLYGNFFGQQYGFWTQYRVAPDPYLDKIWTNVEYRADVYEVLDENGTAVVPEEYLINGDVYGELDDTYKENESFTDYEVWNEYQDTGIVPLDYKSSCVDPARKRFRIWRLTIPRTLHKVTGKPSLDRIRNPWINIRFDKRNLDGRNLMQMHDFIIKYFE